MRQFVICSLIVHGVVFGVLGNRTILRLVVHEDPVVRIKVVPEVGAQDPSTLSVAAEERRTDVRTAPETLRRHILHHRAIHKDSHHRARRRRVAMRLLEPPRPDLFEWAGGRRLSDAEVTEPQERDRAANLDAVLPEHETAMTRPDEATPVVQTAVRDLLSASPTAEEELWPWVSVVEEQPNGEEDAGERGLYEPARKNGVRLPEYPRSAREKGYEGTVILRASVTPQGDVCEVVVERSSGFSTLDAAALDALKQWRFTPARRDGHPVAASVVVPFRFKLTN